MADTVKWLEYELNVYPPQTPWNDVAGIYIFSGLNLRREWVAFYIGQADSFRSRFSNHERWGDAVKAGATHVHAKVVPMQWQRDQIEGALIRAFQPPLNKQLRRW